MTFQLQSWNADRLLRRVPRRILDDYGPLIGAQLGQEIAREQFDWPNVTRRKNGTIVDSPRNIVDTGQFADSQTPPVITEGEGRVELEISWTAPYSGEILRGVTAEAFIDFNGTPGIAGQPGRDWITPALNRQPFDVFFNRRWQQLAPGRS